MRFSVTPRTCVIKGLPLLEKQGSIPIVSLLLLLNTFQISLERTQGVRVASLDPISDNPRPLLPIDRKSPTKGQGPSRVLSHVANVVSLPPALPLLRLPGEDPGANRGGIPLLEAGLEAKALVKVEVKVVLEVDQPPGLDQEVVALGLVDRGPTGPVDHKGDDPNPGPIPNLHEVGPDHLQGRQRAMSWTKKP